MSDLKRDLRSYIDGLEEPVSVQETMAPRRSRRYRVPAAVLAGAGVVLIPALVLLGLRLLPKWEQHSVLRFRPMVVSSRSGATTAMRCSTEMGVGYTRARS